MKSLNRATFFAAALAIVNFAAPTAFGQTTTNESDGSAGIAGKAGQKAGQAAGQKATTT